MNKILVIRFSSIGDIVLTTPVVRCIKEQLAGIQVHYLTKEQFRPLLQSNPYIDKLICIDKEKDVVGVMKELKAENYDFIVDLHKNLRSWKVILSLFKPFGTFTKLNVRKWLICKLKINLLPDVHIVDRYFRAVKSLGVKNDGQGLDYFIPEGTDPWANTPELPHNAYTALVIGGKHATKQLPKERLAELCSLLKGPVVILGGPEDKDVADFLVSSHKSEAGSPTSNDNSNGLSTIDYRLHNACGQLSLNESAVMIQHAAKVITHDTGLMHIAAAFKKDIVSIWGNTIPAFGMYPYFPANHQGNSQILEVNGLPCRPCSKLGYSKCPKGHFKCMNEIVFDGEP